MNKEPKTLQEAIVYFSDRDNCRDYLVARRWPNGVTCPTCGSEYLVEKTLKAGPVIACPNKECDYERATEPAPIA